ncbi:AraC family transcriptional regulator [Niallia circulans]|nr:AraC family transcriptional regulator [Niallia circulans]
MDSLQRMLNSIEYIESHLDNELLLDEIAAIACMSRVSLSTDVPYVNWLYRN